MQHKSVVLSEGLVCPSGPYSHAVIAGDFVFISGQGAMDAATGDYVKGGIREQTIQTLKNVQTILNKLGLSMTDVVKVGAFLRHIHDFREFNSTYGEFFKANPPARTTVQAILPNEKMLVEIEAVAMATHEE